MKSIIITFILFLSIKVVTAQKEVNNYKTDTSTLKFQVKLQKVELTPDCGDIAWATTQKFEVLQNGMSSYPKKFILIIQSCPEFLGNNFFQVNNIYDVIVYQKRPIDFNYTVINSHEKEKLSTYWCSKISLAKSYTN